MRPQASGGGRRAGACMHARRARAPLDSGPISPACISAPPHLAESQSLFTSMGIGNSYLKAQYREYTDGSFKVGAAPPLSLRPPSYKP